MGRAIIAGGGTDGLYQIHVDYGSDRVAELLEPINARIAELNGWMADKTSEIEEKEAEGEADKIAAIDEAMDDYKKEKDKNCSDELWKSDPVADELAALRDAIQDQGEKRDEIDREVRDKAAAEADLVELQAQLAAAQSALDLAMDELDDADGERQSTYAALLEKQYDCTQLDPPDLTPECYAEEQAAYELALFYYVYWQGQVFDLQIPVDEAQAAVDAKRGEIDSLTSQIAEDEELLETLNTVAKAAQDAYAKALVDRAKELERCDPKLLLPQIKAINKAYKVLQEYRAELDKLKNRLRLMAAELAGLLLRKARLEALPAEMLEKDLDAWCVDLTEDLSGEVGTIEIPGEPTNAINIVPGYVDASPTDADGQVVSREVMSPAQSYFNAAILPGWQKWMPTYRVGEIVDLDYDADTASVMLDDATSSGTTLWPPTGHPNHMGGSVKTLDVNQARWLLDDISVVYMNCNAKAFDIGDRVVVRAAQTGPGLVASPESIRWTVIGFETNPQECPEDVPPTLICPVYVRATEINRSSQCPVGEFFGIGGTEIYMALPNFTEHQLWITEDYEYIPAPYPFTTPTIYKATWYDFEAGQWVKHITDLEFIAQPVCSIDGTYTSITYPPTPKPGEFASPPSTVSAHGREYAYDSWNYTTMCYVLYTLIG